MRVQEARYLLFTPVAQSALRRFMRDAFNHMQMLDAGYLGSQSTGGLSPAFSRGACELVHVHARTCVWQLPHACTRAGELSRVFSRGVRGMEKLLRLLVFNVVPTALEAALAISLLIDES